MQLFIVFISFIFTLHVSGSHKPIIRGISSCFFYIQPFGSCGVYVAHMRVPVDWFVVVVSLYWCRGGSPVLVSLRVPVDCFIVVVSPPRQTSPQAHADERHKHHMNQMVVYKKQLEIPLMMGL